jgi:hypothetical protein
MNHEPIHFLPVEKFWNQRQPAPANRFALGFVVGFTVAALLFVLVANYLLR